MELRDYQQRAVAWLGGRRRGLVVAPAGSGKTVIGAAAIAAAACPGRKIHWIANTIEQREQAAAAIQKTPCCVDMDVTLHCAASNPQVQDADILVLDECHHLGGAETWQYIVGQVGPACIVWGLTATPDHEDPERNAAMHAFFPHRFCIDRQALLDAGHLVEGRVIVHDLDTEGEFDAAIEAQTSVELKERMRKFPYLDRWEQQRRIQWAVTQKFLYANENRNATMVGIANAAVLAHSATLVLVQSIEHGQVLGSRIQDSFVIHSGIGKKKRAKAIEDFRTAALGCAICTSLADEGLDVPRASVLVLAAAGRSAGKLEQRAGRVLRPFEGKTGGVIHDFRDLGAQFAAAQCRARLKTYEKLGYDVEIKSYR